MELTVQKLPGKVWVWDEEGREASGRTESEARRSWGRKYLTSNIAL